MLYNVKSMCKSDRWGIRIRHKRECDEVLKILYDAGHSFYYNGRTHNPWSIYQGDKLCIGVNGEPGATLSNFNIVDYERDYMREGSPYAYYTRIVE